MEPLISVIVPVYNVEPYLRKCVDSILNQTYRNLEVILVDDGSPDVCPAICDEYAAMDNRVRVIHKENEGQAIARNTALENATGDYVTFVDADDWIDLQLYEKVMRYAPFDVALFGCTYYDSQTGKSSVNQACEKSVILTWADDIECVANIVNSSLFGYAGNKVYRKGLVESIRMPNAPMREDFLFNVAAFSKTRQIQLVDCAGYYYVQHEGSTLRKRYSGRVPDIGAVAEQMITLHPDISLEINSKLANSTIKQYICDTAYKYIFMNAFLSEDEAIEALRRVFQNDVLASKLRFYRSDCSMFFLLTLCIKIQSPALFYRIVKRKWHA